MQVNVIEHPNPLGDNSPYTLIFMIVGLVFGIYRGFVWLNRPKTHPGFSSILWAILIAFVGASIIGFLRIVLAIIIDRAGINLVLSLITFILWMGGYVIEGFVYAAVIRFIVVRIRPLDRVFGGFIRAVR